MPNLVTAVDVCSIIPDYTGDDPTMEIFINAAHAVISKVFSGDSTVGDTLLREIERFYAAHLYVSNYQRQTTEEKIGEASVKYTGKFGSDLGATSFGQTVRQLDITGKMAAFLGQKGATLYAIPQK